MQKMNRTLLAYLPLMPVRQLLIGMYNTEYRCFLEGFADYLQAHGQAGSGEAARK